MTVFVAAFALSAGLAARRTTLLGLAVFAGQLSVGWCNDYVDAGRDRAAGRRGKPVVAGAVSAGALEVATGCALVACVLLSSALGARPALVHLAAVASAWTYNLWLKFTVASFLPYLVSFGLVPVALVAAALPGSPAPRAAVVLAGGLLGVSAHFANTVGDAQVDAATGVRGLPQLLGPRRSVAVSAALVAAVSVLLILVSRRTPAALVLLVASGCLATACVAGATFRLAAGSPLAFRLNMGAAALVVAGFLASGTTPTLNG